jgi:GT2 family glycosyltransferase
VGAGQVRTVAAVIPIHNGLPLTVRCIKSLQASTRVADHIVIVDDGSSDGSAKVISAEFPSVEVVNGNGNLWWAGAMNLGVKHAATLGADVYFSLNNDCVVAPDALSNLVCALNTATVSHAAVCSQVRRWPDGDWIVSAGGSVNWWWKGITARCWGPPSPCATHRAEVDWFPGMGSLVRMDDYFAVGGYDERRFPHYRADVDFALRLRQSGCRLIYEPASLILNDLSQTGLQARHSRSARKVWQLLTDRRSQYNVQETLPFFWRHAPRHIVPVTIATYYGSFARAVIR